MPPEPPANGRGWPLLPVRRVVYPSQIASFAVGRPRSVALVDEALGRLKAAPGRLSELARASAEALVCVVLLRDNADPDAAGADGLHSVATICRLLEVNRVAPASGQAGARGGGGGGGGGGGQHGAVYVVVLQGLHRLQLEEEPCQRWPFFRASGRTLPEPQLEPVRAAALGLTLQALAQDLLQLLQPPQRAASVAASLKAAGWLGAGRNLDAAALSRLSDALAAAVDGEPAEKQRVLECVGLGERAEVVVSMIKRQLEVLRLSQKIDAHVKGELTRGQRDFYLRRQLKAIRDELGEEEGDEAAEVAAKLRAARLPPRARVAADRELRRLKQMQPSQAEHSVVTSCVGRVGRVVQQLRAVAPLQRPCRLLQRE